MQKNLIIIGGGGFAREVLWLAQCTNEYKMIGFLDDNLPKNSVVAGYPVLGTVPEAQNFSDAYFIVAIGNPRVRKTIVDKLVAAKVLRFATLIHPSVNKSESVRIDEGSMICANVILTVDIHVGAHGILNIGSLIGHDCKLGKFNTVAPVVSLAGGVVTGECVEIGMGALLRQQLRVGPGAMVGMGSTVVKDVPENQIFVGNPAKFLRNFE